ncbi:MAG: hypothetical protein A2358_00120 [Candidatus Staskawiczbacteria bacterium RIFOXYB1_FULL_37_44]|uniref:DUF4352 domain-containing protein n=1 Tax=Candidatus Staskawiczbacteria bacterium RIFOXYB1_FULL_37_44 TaxID=1802223 RepID=A0A1G2IX02_9BACT|nr:MAG: hypothetical protein A2358_00120 [Candidatus Staskawiczbacteria bacterium RIFOXYB1_FULL_37_44]OGZ83715.1 MAG: hypothetical protein A2416_03890 [Candidatus Staskawiczbacteria bacterium RIFOXYC1_FULL_37_52]OGZ88597.1 MAG: hypothetical protein A2444_02780 [Candidatus Staskawiczbacteria bacterium RIFOXYC2_FULL_37_19]OGZ90239.1 MAG: hypothetical protein A2581_02420 [Candidatus Staskawiczbacteria bacterium RIFOXYD1_FULL_37_110]
MKINKEGGSPRRSSAEAGQASRLLLVLAIIVLVAAVIVFLVMKMAEKPAAPSNNPVTTVPVPVYDQQLGNIRFIFESALDKGGVLKASEIIKTQYGSSYQKDLNVSNTGAKFIQITIGAQNKGTENTEQGAWDIENIVDSEGRNFVPLDQYAVQPWLPNPNLCGALLKPAFDPTPCVKIYEVSKASTGLKIRIRTGKDNKSSNLSSSKADVFLLDLIVK